MVGWEIGEGVSALSSFTSRKLAVRFCILAWAPVGMYCVASPTAIEFTFSEYLDYLPRALLLIQLHVVSIKRIYVCSIPVFEFLIVAGTTTPYLNHSPSLELT